MAAPDFHDLEQADGVRLSWNVWPNSKVEATKCVVPFGAMYTPCKDVPNMPVVPYEPVRCKACRAVLNPFARVDFLGKIWICPFCYQVIN
jgi:protein transport protein SEC23